MIRFVATSSQYLASAASMSLPSQTTVSFWITLLVSGTYGMIFRRDDAYKIDHDTSNRLQTYLHKKFNKPAITSARTIGQRYHVAVLDNGVGNNKVYFDGVLDTDHTDQTDTPTSGVLYVATYDGTLYFGNHRIEDLRIYNRMLSLDEIETIFACQGVDGIRHGLLHKFMFNEGAEDAVASGAGSVKDLAGGLHLTPYNSPTYQPSELKWRRAA